MEHNQPVYTERDAARVMIGKYYVRESENVGTLNMFESIKATCVFNEQPNSGKNHLKPSPNNIMVGSLLSFSVQNLQVLSFNKAKHELSLYTIPPCRKSPSPESVLGSKPPGESYHLVLSL